MTKIAIIGTGIQGLFSFWYLEKKFNINADIYDISESTFGGRLHPIKTPIGELNKGCHYFSIEEKTSEFLDDILGNKNTDKFLCSSFSIQNFNGKEKINHEHALPTIFYKNYVERNSNLDFDSFESLYSLNKFRYGEENAKLLSKLALNFAGVDTKKLDVISRGPLQYSRVTMDLPYENLLSLKRKSSLVDEDIAVPKSFRKEILQADSLQVRGGMQIFFKSEFISNLKSLVRKFCLNKESIGNFLKNSINGQKYDLIIYTGSPIPFISYFKGLNLSNYVSKINVSYLINNQQFSKRLFIHDYTKRNITRVSIEPFQDKNLIIVEQHNKNGDPEYAQILKYLNIREDLTDFITKTTFPAFIYLPNIFNSLYKSTYKNILELNKNIIIPQKISYSTSDLIENISESLDNYFYKKY